MRTKAVHAPQATETERLPSLPHILLQLLDIIQDEGVSFEHIAEIVRCDPSLTLKVLAASPHPLSGIDALEKAITRIGLDTIRSISVTSSVWQFFSRTSDERSDFLKQYWRHSLLCAGVAQAVAEALDYSSPDEAWLAGLLHDIGQLSLESNYPDKYTATLAKLSEDSHFHEIENEAFGTTHQQTGYDLLKKHGAPPMVCDAVRHHHADIELLRDAHLLVRVTCVANLLSSADFSDNREAALDATETLLELPRQQALELLTGCQEKTDAIAERFEIVVQDPGDESDTTVEGDQQKQIRLAEQVRNIAMLNGVHQHLSHIDDHNALIEAIRQNLAIIFGYEHSIVFLYDAADDTVCAQGTGSELDRYLNEICIPLEPGRSLITNTLLKMCAITSFEPGNDPLSIVDRQVIDLCGGEGILCQPLIVNNAAVGVLALGIGESSANRVRKQASLLKRFASETANTINALHRRESAARGAGPDEFGKLMHARTREVIHEVRNPLSIINNYLEILGYKLKDDDPAQQDLGTIRDEISRVNTILEKLSGPVQTDTRERSLVDVNALIADLSHMFQTSLFNARSISISLNLDDELPPMLSNADALKQIYTNLVKNSVEALPAEGQVMVYTQDNVNVDGQPHFEICVADDGPGIPTNILPRLFTPVETTKGGGHAGLGLTIVKNLVNELHGSISCRSSDNGTSFHILLPRALDD